MKILKQGNIHQHKFTCGYCGCEFIASENEYKIKKHDEPTGKFYSNFFDSIEIPEYITTITLLCSCPTCTHNVEDVCVSKDQQTLQKFMSSYKENNNSTTIQSCCMNCAYNYKEFDAGNNEIYICTHRFSHLVDKDNKCRFYSKR